MNFRYLIVLALSASVLFACTDDEEKVNCGNGKLEASEVCDGALFKEGTRICPEGTVGDVSKISCSKTCTLVTQDVCKPATGCNNDGVLDAGEICDGKSFADGVRVCPEGTIGNGDNITCSDTCTLVTELACKPENCIDGIQKCNATKSKLLVCKYGAWVTSEECESGKTMCSDVAQTCVEACGGAAEKACLDVNTFVSCSVKDEKVEMTHKNCAELGMYCDAAVDGGCSSANKCVDNVLTICSKAGGCDEIDCSEMGQICDVAKGDCVKAESLACDAEHKVLTINGPDSSYSYDCSKNTNDDVVCNPKLGCSYAYCKGLNMMLCDKDKCSTLEICTKACDDEALVCVCDESEVKCKGDVATTCVGGKYVTEDCSKRNWKCSTTDGHSGCYNEKPCVDDEEICDERTYSICIDNTWMSELCKEGTSCTIGKGCSVDGYEPKCNNGFVETGEVCDDKVAVWQTCKDLDAYKDWSKDGKPACVGCELAKGSCRELALEEIKTYTFPNKESIVQLVTDKVVTLLGAFTISEYSVKEGKDGWSLGPWGNATNPNFNDRYVSFVVGSVSGYEALSLNFDVARNNNGPRNLRVAIYNDSTKVTDFAAVSPAVAYQNSGVLEYKDMSKLTGEVSVRIAGYASSSEKTGTMQISNLVISGKK